MGKRYGKRDKMDLKETAQWATDREGDYNSPKAGPGRNCPPSRKSCGHWTGLGDGAKSNMSGALVVNYVEERITFPWSRMPY